MNSLVELQKAVVLVERYPVLAGADLRVSVGESIALVGANGAGKTSVLRLLAGLSRLHSGSATVCGFDLGAERRAVRGAAGYVAHRPFAYEDLTVAENLRLLARRSGASVADALEHVGLDGRSDVRAASLSSGQRRRLGLAGLMVRDCALWLLDEPYSGLDPAGRETLDRALDRARRDGKTIVFSSHDAHAQRTSATRTVVVSGGIIQSTQDNREVAGVS